MPSTVTQSKTDQLSPFADAIYKQKYSWKDPDGNPVEEWPDTADRVVSNVMGALDYKPGDDEYDSIKKLIIQRKFIPGGRYLYAAGREINQTQNCFMLRAEDSREGWAELNYKTSMIFMTGGGAGVVYSDIREAGATINKTGGTASGPGALMHMVNEIGRGAVQGGSRRAAIWAGLHWNHPDIFDFIRSKDWSEEIRALKKKHFGAVAPMDHTNISVILDDEFFDAYRDNEHPNHDLAYKVYWDATKHMIETGEPGFSIDVNGNAGENLRNPCTEVTSYDDSDVCNLGSINLSRIESLEEMKEVTELASLFLLAGTEYSHVPYSKVELVRNQNRRLGLGLMGIHEWLIKRGYKYEGNRELAEWLGEYANSTDYAHGWADQHDLSRPVKTRAIAPAGTIGIVGETTTGIEPVFCKAMKRRYLHGRDWKYQYVVDPTVKRLTDEGIDPYSIQDAYELSYDVEKRVKFQAWTQNYVDQGISSTINLPYPISDNAEQQDFGDMLVNYLPMLRGVTCYPDGARDGQPLSVADYETAIDSEGVVYEENEADKCASGVCGV